MKNLLARFYLSHPLHRTWLGLLRVFFPLSLIFLWQRSPSLVHKRDLFLEFRLWLLVLSFSQNLFHSQVPISRFTFCVLVFTRFSLLFLFLLLYSVDGFLFYFNSSTTLCLITDRTKKGRKRWIFCYLRFWFWSLWKWRKSIESSGSIWFIRFFYDVIGWRFVLEFGFIYFLQLLYKL